MLNRLKSITFISKLIKENRLLYNVLLQSKQIIK